MAENINITNDKGTIDAFAEVMSSSTAALDKNSLDAFISLLELDDAKFDAMYPTMKESIKQGFEDPSVRTELLTSLRRTPIRDIEQEKAGAQEFIENIKNADDLSENKKEFLITIIEYGILSVIELYNNPREKIKVQIQKITDNAVIPKYAHATDAGADVYAIEETIIAPGETELIKTGLKMAIPKGYEVQVRPRSGLSLKTGLRVANAPGTIDASYRGELGIIMTNISKDTYTIEPGDKIAQLVIAPTPMMDFEEVSSLDETERGEGGFGSTDA